MARIRTIKPEFWTDEKLTECSLNARLLFIGTWNFADDQGNLDRSPKQIKARVFPVDSIDCEPLLLELITQGLLIEYSVSGKKYLHVQGFTKHQVINRPSKPQCPPYDASLSTHATLTEPSVNTHNGREGRGRNTSTDSGRDDYPEEFETLWRAYPKRMGDNPKRKAFKAWRARITAGRTADEIQAGVVRYAAFIAATGKAGTEFVKQAATFLGPDEGFAAEWQASQAQNDDWRKGMK